MKKTTQKKSGKSLSGKAVVGLGAAAAAIGAGAYYLFGPKGKQHRGELKKWMSGMQDEVTKKVKSLKAPTQAAYANIVDQVKEKYTKAGKIDAKEIMKFAEDMKKQWKAVTAQNVVKKAKAAVKKVAKSAKNK